MVVSAQAGLTAGFSRTFAALLGAQARALIVERQPRSDRSTDTLVNATSEAQAVLIDRATYLLSETIPAAILHVLTPADRVMNLVRAVEANLPPGSVTKLPEEEHRKIVQYLRALADVADGTRDKVLAFSTDHDAWVSAIDDATDALSEASRAMVDKLGREGGSVGLIEARIVAKRNEIDDDIDDILTSADEIGDKVSDLAAEAIAFLKPDGKKKRSEKPDRRSDKPKDETSKENPPDAKSVPEKPKDPSRLAGDPDIWDDGADDDDRARDVSDGDDDAFDEVRAKEIGAKTVEALKATSGGARDLGDAAARLSRHNRELADLYYDLAGVRGSIAWAQAVGDQGRSLRRAADTIGSSLSDIADSWQLVVQDLRQQAEQIETSGDVSVLRERWSMRDREAWRHLAARLAAIQSAVAGRTRLIAL